MKATRLTRRTLRAAAGPVAGVGVRTGREISVRLLPAASGEGLVLRRTDIGARVPLDLDHALDISNCTAVGTSPEDATLFVEHLMAVLHAHRITDLTVEVSGPEIPLLDGSATPWNELVMAAGIEDLPREVEPLVVAQELRIENGDKWLSAKPGPPTSFAYDLEYENPLIGKQFASFEPDTESFAEMLAPARTFALIEEIEQMTAAGLLKGGSEQNCRIVCPDHYSDPPTLPDEFARHKILDMLGDLYLFGRPVVGQVTGSRTGHAHNRALLRRIAGSAKV